MLSDYQQENLRFWTAVLDDYSFSDVTVDVPPVTNEPSLYVKVRHSGFGGWGLTFASYLYRKAPGIGCYLTCRKDIPQAVQIYENVTASLEELRSELGDDLECWENSAGRPRIGFWRPARLPFAPNDNSSAEFDEAVSWMRDRLDWLVSTLHPRLQRNDCCRQLIRSPE